MMWERVRDLVISRGGSVQLRNEVVRVMPRRQPRDRIDLREWNEDGTASGSVMSRATAS